MPVEISLHKTSFNAIVLMAAEKLLLNSANDVEGLIFHTDKPSMGNDHDSIGAQHSGPDCGHSCEEVLASPRDGMADFLGNPRVMLLTGKQADPGTNPGQHARNCCRRLLSQVVPGLLGQKLDPQRLRRLAKPETISEDKRPKNVLRLQTLWGLVNSVARASPSDRLENAFGVRPVDVLPIDVEVQLTDEALHATANQRRNACLLTCVFAAVYTHYSVNEHDNALVYRMKRSVQDVVCGPATPTRSALTASQSAVPHDHHSVMSSVRDASDFFPWLEGTFLSSVYESHFQLSGSNYSSPDALWRRGYILDGPAMIVGGIRVSQIRSKAKRQYCSRVGLQLLGDTIAGGEVAGLGCSAAMHTHDSGWSFDSAAENRTTFAAHNGRMYRYAPVASHVGTSALGLRYPSPGFFFELPRSNGDVARRALQQHRGNASHPGFVDRQTRALFVDLSVYSLTLDHMCHVRVMVDVPVSGGAFARCIATPIWLANLARPWEHTAGRVVEWIVVVFMFVWLFLRVVLAFNKHLSRYRFSFPTWPHTKTTLDELHRKQLWAQNTQSMAEALSARKAAHRVAKIARQAVEKARVIRTTASSSRRTYESSRCPIVTPLPADEATVQRSASNNDVSRRLEATNSFDSHTTDSNLPKTRTAALLRHSMATPTRAEAHSQSIHTTKHNISVNDERFRFQIERFASDMQIASKYWRSIFIWPLFMVMMIAFWMQAEVYRGWAADTAPNVNATIAARDRYVDFSVSGFWLETSTTLTGVNIFLTWIFVARLAHRFVLAKSVCPSSWKPTKMLAKDRHMHRVAPGISTGLKLIIYTVAAGLVLVGFVCTNVIVYGAHVESFRSFYPALLAVLFLKRPAELGEVDSAALLGPLILLAWVMLIIVLLNFLLAHALDVAAQVYDPVRAKTNSIYDGFQHFADRMEWVRAKVKDVQSFCADFPKLAKAAQHQSSGRRAAANVPKSMECITSGKLDRYGKVFDKLAVHLYKIEQMRNMAEDARLGKLSADDFARRARRHLQSSESVLPVALLSVVSGNAAVLLKHLVHASGRGTGGNAPEVSASGNCANDGDADETKDAHEVDGQNDGADSSHTRSDGMGAIESLGSANGTVVQRSLSQAAQKMLNGIHVEEFAGMFFDQALEEGLDSATAASMVKRVSDVCEAVGDKISDAQDFRSQVEQLQTGQLPIDEFLRSMRQRLCGDVMSTLLPVVGAALPESQRHRARSIVDTVGKMATKQVQSLHRGSGRAGKAVRACMQAAHDVVLETAAATDPTLLPTSSAAPTSKLCATASFGAAPAGAFHRMLRRVANIS